MLFQDKKIMNRVQLVTEELINQLIIDTQSSSKGWSRICLHESVNSLIHCMIMCMLPNINSGMHAHSSNAELITYSYLMNSFTVEIGQNDKICQSVIICKENPVLAIPDSTFRSVRNPSSRPVVYIEQRLGPYRAEKIEWFDSTHKN